MKMLIQYNDGITEVQGFTSDIKKIYLGKRELLKEEIKYLNDTKFWNIIENLDILKNFEKELNKLNK